MYRIRKVFKGEYEFPLWFSPEAKKLISKLLVADPEKRFTISAVTKIPWFIKEFSRSSSFSSIEENNTDQKQESKEPSLVNRSKSAPPFYNAFEFISTMSSGFDLSSLFEGKRKSRFSIHIEMLYLNDHVKTEIFSQEG
ncbi:hypothetical protein RDI58_002631 [Solanum bulbocastanum]|uniref:non-specific serine/threonine protein kinase n=1 Tax=Solanum bulbocastanum TaxID=147425 RepID=A0AAN8U4H1_SOLBU